MTMHRRSVLKALAALPGFAAPAFAQSYPDRAIKLIVPYLAGGATDVGARVVAERMSKGLGQPIVIDNRPGAGVIVGTNAVAKADPDGYTLLITTLAHPINITLQKKLPYDSIADFEPVALMGIINFILVVHPSSPVTDLPSLVKYLKDNPDKANYGSAGTGSPMHLGPELFKSLTGVQANHVPYRGEAAALNDMIGGRLHPQARTVTGPEAVDALRGVRPDICLLSACSLHAVAGPGTDSSRHIERPHGYALGY